MRGESSASEATDADRAVIPCLERHAPPAAELAISQRAGIGPRHPNNRECAAARWREEGHPHSRWLINHGEGTSKAARNVGASIAGFYGWGRSGQRLGNARIGAATTGTTRWLGRSATTIFTLQRPRRGA